MTMPIIHECGSDVPLCGAETSHTDQPCRQPGTYPDGRCEWHTEEDEPRAADVIREGLREGLSTDEIMKDLRRRCPSSNADSSHVHYYRHRMRKAGEDPAPHEGRQPQDKDHGS